MPPMTQNERFLAIAEALAAIRRENIRTLARLKALEAELSGAVPPGLAARLDTRGEGELRDLT